MVLHLTTAMLCHMLQPTHRRGCKKAKIDGPKCLSPMEKMSGIATNIYLRKTLGKQKKGEGLRILKIRVRELFTHGESISTSHACHKGRQPFNRVCKTWLQNYVFFLFMFFYFLGSTRVLPLFLRILRCDEEFRPT